MPIVYKTFTRPQLDARSVTAASQERKNEISTTINKFVELFKTKHLG
jgi:hypothetical protein